MEIKVVMALVMSTPIIYASASHVPAQGALVIEDCEDTLRHVKRDFPSQATTRTSYRGGPRKEFNFYNYDKQGHQARDCHQPKKNQGMGKVMTAEMKKICQEMIMQCNTKSGDFQERKQLTDKPFPRFSFKIF